MPTPPYHPVYRLTVYVPYSVDANEATALTPIPGAVHSDPFVVASAQSIAGAKPYLGLPKGRMGALDPLTKKVTIGTLSITLQDQRTTPGGSNANRWVTAFLGDTAGKHRLLHRKVYIEESLDGGSTWAAYFTGRIATLSLDDPIRVTMTLKDLGAGLARQCFVRRPHATVTYAFLPNFTPVGLPQSWAGIYGAPPLQATFRRYGGTTVGQLNVTPTSPDDLWRAILLKQTSVMTGEEQAVITVGGQTGVFNIKWRTSSQHVSSGGVLMALGAPWGTAVMPPRVSSVPHVYWSAIAFIEAQDPSAPGYMALPADNTACTFYITRNAQATEAMPLFIADVHRVQLLADLVDGKFSFLDSAGHPRPLAGRDTTTFTNFINDPSWGTVRFCITQPMKAVDFIEKYLLADSGLGYRIDGSGRVVPLDLRRTSATASGGTITDDDLAVPCPRWSVDEAGSYLAASINFYQDRALTRDTLRQSPDTYPDYPASGITSVQNTVIVLNPDAAVVTDSADNVLKIDAQGLRLMAGEQDTTTGQLTESPKLKAVEQIALERLTPFSGAVAKLPMSCRRGSAAASSCYPGAWRTVQVTTQPDPASNTRGGQRLMLCLSRTDNGLTTDLQFLDGGAGTVAVAPTIGAFAVNADDPNAIDVSLTLNAAGDTMLVQIAITDTATGAVPGPTDARWTLAGIGIQTGTMTVRQLPKNVRVWLRARSQPAGQSLELPSAWAYLGAPGYIQTGAVAAPSALATSNLFANRVDVGWTVGDGTMAVEVYYAAGGVPGTWTDAMRAYTLGAGATKARLTGLATATAYTVGVRHKDAWGGRSAMATLGFTTSSTAGVAPSPLGIDICTQPPLTGSDTTVLTGVAVALYAADPSYTLELQRAPDSAGAPNVGSAVSLNATIGGTQVVYVDPLPIDGTRYWYRLRTTGNGDTPSAWTGWVSATAAAVPPDIQPPAVRSALQVAATRGTTSGNNIPVTVAVADPLPRGSGYITVSAAATGGATVSPASAVISGAATADLSTTATAAFTVTRGSSPGRVTFTATAAARVASTDAFDVEQIPATVSSITAVTQTVTISGSQFEVTWTASVPGGTTYNVDWSVTESGASGHLVNVASGVTVNTTLTSTPHGSATVTALDSNGSVIAQGSTKVGTMTL